MKKEIGLREILFVASMFFGMLFGAGNLIYRPSFCDSENGNRTLSGRNCSLFNGRNAEARTVPFQLILLLSCFAALFKARKAAYLCGKDFESDIFAFPLSSFTYGDSFSYGENNDTARCLRL